MPRSEATYIPGVVRAAAERKSCTVSEYAQSLGRSRNWLYSLFEGHQPQITPYFRLARAAGLTLDELARAIVERRAGEILTAARGSKSRAAFAKESKVSEALIAGLEKDTGELKALKHLWFLSEILRCKLDDLYTGAEIAQ